VINMGKLHTTLINKTDRELTIFEETSNGALTLVARLSANNALARTTTDLHAKHDGTITATNYVSKNSRSTQELPMSYVFSIDPNDSYSVIRIWYDREAVLGVSTDEMLDNSTITIEFEDGNFIKRFEQRYEIAHNQHWNSRLFQVS
jgi:hypothetical protein